jgi:hypothetical protein
MKIIKFVLFITLILNLILGILILTGKDKKSIDVEKITTWWKIQSIDTVKYSRDLAREKLNNQDFDKDIDTQVRLIAETGATYVALGTPYDPEFTPFLRRWVNAARKYGLNIWFRGNLSGWEGWFGYKKISREEHTNNIQKFILDNKDLFTDGDIFSSCPECENGGPGDPRNTGDIDGYRNFLVEEYKVSDDAFQKIGRDVRSNYMSMNYDVANLIMDRQTTKTLGNIVVIDHYVDSPMKLSTDIQNIAEKSGGKVVLGEFGAPIPDINGKFTDAEQSTWIGEALMEISKIPELAGVNYWTGFGGSTELWDANYKGKTAVGVINKYFKPKIIRGIVKNEIGNPIKSADVSIGIKSVRTDENGKFVLPSVYENYEIIILANGYITKNIETSGNNNTFEIVLVKEKENIFFKIWKFAKTKINI